MSINFLIFRNLFAPANQRDNYFHFFDNQNKKLISRSPWLTARMCNGAPHMYCAPSHVIRMFIACSTQVSHRREETLELLDVYSVRVHINNWHRFHQAGPLVLIQIRIMQFLISRNANKSKQNEKRKKRRKKQKKETKTIARRNSKGLAFANKLRTKCV